VARGESVAVAGSGFAARSNVSVRLASGVDLATFQADDNGAISGDVLIPRTAPLGDTQILASDGVRTLSASLRVTAAAAAGSSRAATAAAGSGILSRTGIDASLLTSIALSLIMVGAVLVIVVRRRRSSATAA